MRITRPLNSRWLRSMASALRSSDAPGALKSSPAQNMRPAPFIATTRTA
jgi:hypothetical protein